MISQKVHVETGAADRKTLDDNDLLLRYSTRVLVWLAPLEFLLGRAISRASRQMPAGDVGAAIFGAISAAGAFLVMPAFILVLLVLILVTTGAFRGRPDARDASPPLSRPLAAALLVFLVFSVASLSPSTPAPVLLVYNLLSAAVVLGIVLTWLPSARGSGLRFTVALLGLAYAGYYVSAIVAILAQGLGVPLGTVGVGAAQAGEAAGMAAGLSLFWAAGFFRIRATGVRPKRWWLVLAGLAALLVLVAALFEQWLQGVATQFSVGFTLFLPVPVTALALAAWVYAALVFNSRDARTRTGSPWAWEAGTALLLLPAAGYQLQLNYQHLLLIAVLLLLTGRIQPFSQAKGVMPLARAPLLPQKEDSPA